MAVYKRNYLQELDRARTGKTVWAYAFARNKVRYRESGFPTKAAAQFAEDKALASIGEGRRPTARSRLSLDEVAEQMFAHRAVSRAKKNVDRERIRFRQLRRFFGSKPISAIGVADVQHYQTTRAEQGTSPRSVNLEIILLRCVFRHAQDHGYITKNPARAVKNLAETQSPPVLITEEQFRKLAAEAPRTVAGKQLVSWLWLMATTGMRPSESFYLEWSDVDFGNMQIMIKPKQGHRLKSGKFRVVEMNPCLLTVLQDWQKEWNRTFSDGAKHNWLFFHPRRSARQAHGFRKSLKKAGAAAGIPDVTMYSFRHYFISKAVMSGVELLTIAKWVGHSSTKMIERTYGHLRPEYRAKQMSMISFGQP